MEIDICGRLFVTPASLPACLITGIESSNCMPCYYQINTPLSLYMHAKFNAIGNCMVINVRSASKMCTCTGNRYIIP